MDERYLLLKITAKDVCSPDDFNTVLHQFNEANKPDVAVEVVPSLCDRCLNEECQEVIRNIFEGTQVHIYVEKCEFATVKP